MYGNFSVTGRVESLLATRGWSNITASMRDKVLVVTAVSPAGTVETLEGNSVSQVVVAAERLVA